MASSRCCCPGCEKPGTNHCSACKTTVYCGPNCQTADWPHHKEECEGHLHKVGMKHLTKATGFQHVRNWMQSLCHCDLALAKLNPMKKRPLPAISELLKLKCGALQEMHRLVESLQCAKENYNLWAVACGPAHPITIDAAFYLIDLSISNKLYEDAELFARTLWEIIHNDRESRDIPAHMRPQYVARAASSLALATYRLAESGGISLEVIPKAGKAAIAHARQSVELSTQLYGTNDGITATYMIQLAQILDFFNDTDDDEILRLCEQTIAIFFRVDGRKSHNVGVSENSLASAYKKRAIRAYGVMDLDRCVTNLELALAHFREAVRIHTTNNNTVDADRSLKGAEGMEEKLRQVTIARAAAAAAVTAARG